MLPRSFNNKVELYFCLALLGIIVTRTDLSSCPAQLWQHKTEIILKIIFIIDNTSYMYVFNIFICVDNINIMFLILYACGCAHYDYVIIIITIFTIL